jgi:MFS transporter, BCD family, chlorophyll transporter
VSAGLGWGAIARLGLVQASIGAIVMVATSLLNRVMVVEFGLAVAIPAGLVAWHYAVQLSRPLWGHGSDQGRSRTPFIVGGMGLLALGMLLAVDAALAIPTAFAPALVLAVLAFTLIGAGVGACGTSLLALLASRVAPERRAGAAALTWIMMVAGIAGSAGIVGALLDPFSHARLAIVAGGVALAAFLLTLVAVRGIEARHPPVRAPAAAAPAELRAALREMRGDAEARRFTLFVFVSMLAYALQDLILEPFAGLSFGMTPAQSTQLAGAQHGGVLAGMILAGVGGSAFFGRRPAELERWILAGCLGSAAALAGLAFAAAAGPPWPLTLNVVLLGLFNGLFAVAAIGAMMGLAGAGRRAREGVRMGVWGAAQAIAFGLGGLLGALGVDAARALTGEIGAAFQLVFAAEAALFMLAAWLALRMAAPAPAARPAVAA